MTKSCVRCGSISELLLNLVCCSSPRCQNFDKYFYRKWLKGCGRTYNVPNKDWSFLGRFISSKPTFDGSSSRLYDLYHNGPEVYAIHCNEEDKVYAGDVQGVPLGYYQHWWSSPGDVDENGREALVEAVARKNI